MIAQLRALGLAVALGLATTPATAKLFRFFGDADFTSDVPASGHTAPGGHISFSFLLESPLPPDAAPGPPYEVIGATDFRFTLDGTPVGDPLEQLIFYDNAQGGLFDLLFAVDNLSFFGADVGSGGLLVPGRYLFDIGVDGEGGFGAGRLSIAAVPEPASWALMIGGFGGVGLALRRVRRTAAPAMTAG